MSVLDTSPFDDDRDAEDILAGLELDQGIVDGVVEEVATEIDETSMVDE